MIEIIMKAVMSFGTRLFMSVATEKMIEWAFFKVAEEIVKKTETPHDDEWFAKVKEVYESGKK